jgi:alkylation response protein AidB-like acyl-CoA dehydrogenase
MDFSLDAEQQQFQESAARFFREQSGFDAWRQCVASGAPFDRRLWSEMAGFGWLALNLPESLDGFGAPPVYAHLLMEQAGRGLSREPLVATAVIGARVLAHAAEPLRSPLAGALARGEARFALALGEPRARFDLAHVETRAQADGDGFVLHGLKSHVPDGATADWLIVPARTSGASADREGISLFLVRADSQGVERSALRAADHHHHARLRLDGVQVGADALVGAPGGGLALLEEVVDHAIAAGLAEAVGIMEALCETTLAYLKTRQQFGVRIGSFQALQHRMVDMQIASEEARAMAWHARAHLAADPLARRRAVSAAKTRVGQTSLFVGHQAVQLHGGVGTTDELVVSHYLKRLVMLEASFGNADHHRQQFVAATTAVPTPSTVPVA